MAQEETTRRCPPVACAFWLAAALGAALALLASAPGCDRAPDAPPSADAAAPAPAEAGPPLPVAIDAPAPGAEDAGRDAAGSPAGDGILVDEWMLLMLAGQPAGSMHVTCARKDDLIVTEMRQEISMSRMGMPLTAEVLMTVREMAEGAPMSFEIATTMASNVVTVTGRIEGGKLRLTSDTMGVERTRELDWPEDALLGYGEERFVRSQALEEGTRYSYHTYDPQLDSVIELTSEVGETAEIDVLGEKVRATRIVKTGGAVPIVEYRDAEGVTWKVRVSMAGVAMEMVRTSREVAVARTAKPASFDVLTDLAVRVRAGIERPREVTAATYRLRLKEGSLDDLDLDGPGQGVTLEADGTALLKVGAVRPRKSPALADLAPGADLRKYLEPSTFAQSDDPEIVRVAREVTARARSSLDAAKRLQRWVERNLTNKGFGTGFATASEVMKEKAGDCSEHAVLLAALLRAGGIPSRGVMGLVYADLGGRAAFWYHMWAEAWVGEWVPLDAAIPGAFVDAARIRLGELDLAGMSPGGEMAKLVNVLGQLEVQVIAYESGGRTYEVGPRTELEGGRYRDLDDGVSFALPDGWDLVRAGDSRLEEKGGVAALVETAGEGRIVLISTPAAEGRTLDGIVDRMGRVNAVSRRRAATLGGAPAVRVSYESGGKRREGVATVRGGRFYLLRLEPASEAGVRALEAVAESFRFD